MNPILRGRLSSRVADVWTHTGRASRREVDLLVQIDPRSTYDVCDKLILAIPRSVFINDNIRFAGVTSIQYYISTACDLLQCTYYKISVRVHYYKNDSLGTESKIQKIGDIIQHAMGLGVWIGGRNGNTFMRNSC